MLVPKIKEKMMKIQCRGCTIRFWLSDTSVRWRVMDYHDSNRGATLPFRSPEELMEDIERYFIGGIAAVEVLDGHGNGFVHYYEWP